ncbi:hypothetical protein K438DRAFT_1975481 [Mycena galopus ATCC 62051]|nr:hypothetical protein K438DRAFT_1975481 [Mycena galopus ATCC 62051]
MSASLSSTLFQQASPQVPSRQHVAPLFVKYPTIFPGPSGAWERTGAGEAGTDQPRRERRRTRARRVTAGGKMPLAVPKSPMRMRAAMFNAFHTVHVKQTGIVALPANAALEPPADVTTFRGAGAVDLLAAAGRDTPGTAADTVPRAVGAVYADGIWPLLFEADGGAAAGMIDDTVSPPLPAGQTRLMEWRERWLVVGGQCTRLIHTLPLADLIQLTDTGRLPSAATTAASKPRVLLTCFAAPLPSTAFNSASPRTSLPLHPPLDKQPTSPSSNPSIATPSPAPPSSTTSPLRTSLPSATNPTEDPSIDHDADPDTEDAPLQHSLSLALPGAPPYCSARAHPAGLGRIGKVVLLVLWNGNENGVDGDGWEEERRMLDASGSPVVGRRRSGKGKGKAGQRTSGFGKGTRREADRREWGSSKAPPAHGLLVPPPLLVFLVAWSSRLAAVFSPSDCSPQ